MNYFIIIWWINSQYGLSVVSRIHIQHLSSMNSKLLIYFLYFFLTTKHLFLLCLHFPLHYIHFNLTWMSLFTHFLVSRWHICVQNVILVWSSMRCDVSMKVWTKKIDGGAPNSVTCRMHMQAGYQSDAAPRTPMFVLYINNWRW